MVGYSEIQGGNTLEGLVNPIVFLINMFWIFFTESRRKNNPNEGNDTSQITKETKSMNKSKSTGSILKPSSTSCVPLLQAKSSAGQQSVPLTLKKQPYVGFSGTRPKPLAPAKPMQKVIPFVSTKKSPPFEPHEEPGEAGEDPREDVAAGATRVSFKENSDPDIPEVRKALCLMQ